MGVGCTDTILTKETLYTSYLSLENQKSVMVQINPIIPEQICYVSIRSLSSIQKVLRCVVMVGSAGHTEIRSRDNLGY